MNRLLLSLLLLLYFGIVQAQDPVFDWAVQFGGKSNDMGTALDMDSQGNIFCTGEVGYDAVFADQNLSLDFAQAFVAKFTSEGNLLWVRSCGGKGLDISRDIKCDSDDNCIITGFFSDSAHFGDTTILSSHKHDVFIAKFDNEGNFLWVTRGAGLEDEEAYCLATDPSNNIYVGGWFESTMSLGSNILDAGEWDAMFVAKLKQDGQVIWARQSFPGEFGEALVEDMVVDQSGDLIVCGYFNDQITLESTSLTSLDGNNDILLIKYDPGGSVLWISQSGGAEDDEAHGVCVDENNNIYLAGEFSELAVFDTITLETPYSPTMCLGQLNSDGHFQWVKKAGGTFYNAATGISYSMASGLAVCGWYHMDLVLGDYIFTGGKYDVFVATFTKVGEVLKALTFGGNGDERPEDIYLADGNKVYTIGQFTDTVVFENTVLVEVELEDVFFTRINPDAITTNTELSDFQGTSGEFMILSPVPTGKYIRIRIPGKEMEGSVSISDISGKLVKKYELYRPGEDCSVEDLVPGIYLINFSDGNTPSFGWFIKE